MKINISYLKFFLLLYLAININPFPAFAGNEIVIDDFSNDCKLIGVWADNKGNNDEGKGFSGGGTIGSSYHYTSRYGKWKKTGQEKAIWTPNITKPGKYKVEVSWRGTENRSSKVTYEVTHLDGKSKKTFSQKTKDMTWENMGTFNFKAGKSGNVAFVSDGGSSACIDAARFTYVGKGDSVNSGTGNTGTTGSLSDIYNTLTGGSNTNGATTGTANGTTTGTANGTTTGTTTGTANGAAGGDNSSVASGSIRLDSSSTGEKSFTLASDGHVKASAYLTTYGPASLGVTIKKADGTMIEWLKWCRNNDVDPSPLMVNGSPDEGSMISPKSGDFSPQEVSHSYEGSKGDTLIIKLDGDFGGVDPYIEVTGPSAD